MVRSLQIPIRKRSHKKAFTIILVLIIVVIGWNIFQLYSLTQVKVNYSFSKIEITYGRFLLTGLNLSITLQVTNPSPLSILVPDIDYTIYLGGQMLTSGHITGGGALSSGSATLIQIPLSFSSGQLDPALISVLNQYISTHTITTLVTGNAYPRISLIPILPVYYTFSIPFSITKTVPF
ncbi:MAG: hypothetical protein QG670_941 [Thermoproteota archaeon]|nr:hypothetical protein [Thermoproteota archaeon]